MDPKISRPDIFVHDNGICESENVGAGTKIWAFAHVLKGARIGQNCNICDHVYVESGAVIGNEVTIKAGVQLWDGVTLGDGVFVGPNATFTNDRFPRAMRNPDRFLETMVEEGASIGANATILPGLRIGRAAMVGAGAVVTKHVPANAIVVGNPAVIVGYQTERPSWDRLPPTASGALPSEPGSRVGLGFTDGGLWRLPHYVDMRGSLVALDFAKDLPFPPQRIFVVHGVSNHRVRGEHAHRTCHQLLVATHGKLAVVLDDGLGKRVEVMLDDPTIGLHVPPMIWAVQYKFDPGTVLLVLASESYDAGDYIRDYQTFRGLVLSRAG